MFKKLINVGMFLAACAVVFSLFMFLTMPGQKNSGTEPTKTQAVKISMPVDLAGKWESTTSKTGTKMVAEVKDNTIFVEMYVNDGYTGLWYGTFDILQPGQNTIVSKFIQDNQNHRALSTAETKEFLYQGQSLIFDYSVMGTRTTVEMKRV